jgi:hypothetical protein
MTCIDELLLDPAVFRGAAVDVGGSGPVVVAMVAVMLMFSNCGVGGGNGSAW